MTTRVFARYLMARLLFVPLLVAASALAADTQPATRPTSPAAAAAIAKAERAVEAARAAFNEAAAKARKIEVEELKAAQQIAMKAGNLAEANAIEATIKAIDVDKPGPKTPEEKVVAQRLFSYVWPDGARPIELLADGKVGVGGGSWEQHWKIENGALVITGSRGVLTRMAPDGRGGYVGEIEMPRKTGPAVRHVVKIIPASR